MEAVKAGRAVVDPLRAEGVRHVFGLPGGHVLSIYDALFDTPEITHILTTFTARWATTSSGSEAVPGRCSSGSRVVYVDSAGDFPGMLELVEYSEAQDCFYTSIYEATLDWDGTNPVRKEN